MLKTKRLGHINRFLKKTM
jgi:hypothetical protein